MKFWIITISVIKNKTVKNGECYDRIKVAVTVLFIKYKKQEVDSECKKKQILKVIPLCRRKR